MIKFKSVLHKIAKTVKMHVPADDSYSGDIWFYYPNYALFVEMQLGAECPYEGCAIDNAKIIAKIPAEQCETLNRKQLLKMGFAIGSSSA